MDLEEYLTTKQAAQELGIREDSIRRLARLGKLKVKKFGYFSMFHKDDVKAYKNREETRGRPKKSNSPESES